MAIHLYNSLTKTKDEFIPLHGRDVKMYSCGVTVYDQCHLGHARSLYVFDVIRRYLSHRGFNVHFVRNITDIDDKIINKAIELGITSDEVTAKNIKEYYRDLDSLGVARADKEPRATENIEAIIKAIEVLIAKGYAYANEGDVYYQVRKFDSYGKLSGQSIDQMLEGVRIDPGAKKKDPLDFALWKQSREGEPFWESPWGRGRPGWHIECSCMSMDHLDCTTLDIHAGGRDLVFPHHENEIAQSEAMTGAPFAKYWIHHGLLTINSQKMAKSLGNFITIQDSLKRFSVDQIKFFFLSSHYGSNIDFTEEKMEEARKALQKFDILFRRVEGLSAGDDQEGEFNAKFEALFLEAMDDDFNTAKALGVLFEWVNETNKYLDQHKEDPSAAGLGVSAARMIKALVSDLFGLFTQGTDKVLSAEDETFLAERSQARAQKNFQRSDELRDLLKAHGIIVEDGKDGQVWRWA